MSYCRFENTYRNLVDCAQAMNETLSESERKYKEKLVNVCQEIIEEYELNNLAEWNETEYGDNDENDNDVSWDTQTK